MTTRQREVAAVGGVVERVGAPNTSTASSTSSDGTSHRLVRSVSRRQAGIREVSGRMSGVSAFHGSVDRADQASRLTALDVTGGGRGGELLPALPPRRASAIKIQPEMARRLLSAVALAFLANVAIANATVSQTRTSPTRITARS